MKKLVVFLLFTFVFESKSQSFLFSDIGNSILTRPNVGYEYRWKKNSISASLQYQRNAMFWLTEFPSFVKTSGLRLDLAYKFYFKNHFFLESKFRTQFYDAPFFLDGWHGDSIFNSNRSIEFAEKIGFKMNQKKRLQFDFGVGVGAKFTTMPVSIRDDEKINGVTDAELKSRFYEKSKGLKNIYVPHVQLRMFYKLK